MARVPYVSYEDAPEEVRTLYDGQFELSGRLPNFHQLLGHLPWIYRWYVGLQASANHGPLPTHIKRLVHVQTSLVNRCAYCTSHNWTQAVDAGVPEEKLAALEHDTVEESGLFTDAEIAAVRWTTAVAQNTARPDREAFAAMERHFTTAEIVETTFLIALRTLTNRLQEALWTDLEEGGLPPRLDTDDADLAAYARDVLVPQLEK